MLTSVINTPLAPLEVKYTNKHIKHTKWLVNKTDPINTNHPLIVSLQTQIKDYFNGSINKFKCPTISKGTIFQKSVWKKMSAIPAGKTVSYGELAKTLGSSAQAIGQACKRNPLPFIVPCHRVVGKDTIGGFMGKSAGKEIRIKTALLTIEFSIGIAN